MNPPGTLDDEVQAFEQWAHLAARFVRRHWKLIAAVWLATIIPTAAYAVFAIPEYTSKGAVQVSEGSGLAGLQPFLELGSSGAPAQVATEIEIMRRREFMATVLEGLKLHIVDADAPSLVTWDLEVARGQRSPLPPSLVRIRSVLEARVREDHFEPIPLRLVGGDATSLTVELLGETPERHEARVGVPLPLGSVELEFSDQPLEPGEALAIKVLPEGHLLREYAEHVAVVPLGSTREPTNIVEVIATHRDRQTARAIVHAMTELYLEQTLAFQAKSASQAAAFIEKQLEEVSTRLREAEEKLLTFSQEHRAVELGTQVRVAIENSAELEAQRLALELQERTIGNVLARLRRGGDSNASTLTANFFDDPVLAASVAELTSAETKYETLRASLTEDHPEVRVLRQALELHRKHVQGLLRSAQKNLAAQRRQLETELLGSEREMETYPDKRLELARLTRDMEVSQRLYTLLLEKLEEAEILQASTTTDKRVVDAASLPAWQANPQRGKLVVLGSLLGIVSGMAVALALSVLRRRLDTVESIRDLVSFPAYGIIPQAEGAGQQRLAIRDVWADVHDPLPEAFRALGVSVSLLPGEVGRGKVVMLTSSRPGEGKSTVAGHLTEALARSGRRVLLVDLDLRRPTQHRLWGVPREPGYSDLIAEGGNPEALLRFARRVEETGPVVLTAGTRLPDTVAAIMAPTLRSLLDHWAEEFDFVLVDAPPAFVAETLALARLADLLLLVARPGVIERASLRHALEALDRLEMPKGLILNAVGPRHADELYGSGYYYGRTYGSNEGTGTTAHG